LVKISVYIPVYKESRHLEKMLNCLTQDPYPEKEIVVCIDEPTPKSRSLIDEYPGVIFRFSRERLGKVSALNAAVAETTGEYLLFLDSDLEIRIDKLLEAVANELDKHELVELKKRIIRDSLISRIVSYDYLSENFTSYIFARYLHRCLSFNGAAFAIRRSIFLKLIGFGHEICEDLDIAIRSWKAGVDFGYSENAEVWNSVDPSLRIWINQRRRWGIGLGNWLRDNWKLLISTLIQKPKIILPALFILFPSLTLILQLFFLPSPFSARLITVTLLLLSSWANIFATPTLIIGLGIVAFYALLLTTLFLSVYACIFYYFARRLGFAFNLLEFSIYFLIYNPLWLTMTLATFFRVLVWRGDLKLDWKV
jgi:poly-beta-1,6-N-acetyl-D-glucosamine synthase